MVTLASCDHTSGTHNGEHIEWSKEDTLHAATTARTSIALVSEGRQRIEVCSRRIKNLKIEKFLVGC